MILGFLLKNDADRFQKFCIFVFCKYQQMSKKYQVIGLMSGSSLDGLDMAHCEINIKSDPFEVESWSLTAAETIAFSTEWQRRLAELPQQSAFIFCQTHADFGHYLGAITANFIQKNGLKPDFIASHGHTIFHCPEKKFTTQIGDGAAIAVETNCKVVCDFRTHDIALGGEGTPLAATADRYLFAGYDFYLNIGGIANLTCRCGNGKYVAFDVGAANQVFNALSQTLGFLYDDEGKIAAQGKPIPMLFEELNDLDFFSKKYPKSLDNNWLRENITQKYLDSSATVADKLRTAYEQLAFQIAQSVRQIEKIEDFSKKNYSMLVTGGGAFNIFLMKTIEKYCPNIEIIIPEKNIIQFKEAALMALLGVMRVEQLSNCMHFVTGARRDSIGGAIYL